MQLTRVNYWNKWMRNGRRPARPVTRFKADKPLVLRNEVTSGTKLSSDVVCIQQMMDMLSCFKDNEFDQIRCEPQINAFQNCYNKFVDERKLKNDLVNSSVPIPGETKLKKDQLNVLLKRWPQPN
ncbi:coiled-coil-helix-coiled-coil-helix domain-containing protein 1-like [Oppia nitens]|uniref:coiled-coil-helix-coiled-coil-helix domain-containing protein 1-like n=1 Tax=Oppia nitens TaxID=1686743 RepID=UPI0023D9D55C|nr:coiled-coil-helix-coiled-coil-helix domain-containing protein 1-like [Oppia nitens]